MTPGEYKIALIVTGAVAALLVLMVWIYAIKPHVPAENITHHGGEDGDY